MDKGKTILITGASRGLGLELALAWLEAGHRIVGLIRKLSGGLASIARERPNLSWVIGDVGDEDSLKMAAAEAGKLVGKIDLLVNNAAIHLEMERPDFPSADIDSITETLRINSTAPLAVVKNFYPLLMRGSRIVNISSEAGSIGMSERKSEYGYCMSKAALNMLSKLLRNRLAPEGIYVFAVHPGWFSSDMGTPAAPVTPRSQARLLAKTIDALRDDSPLYFDWTGKELPY